MVLRLNISLKLAESIMSVHPHQTTQAQHQHSSVSRVNTALLACHRQCQRIPLSVAPNFYGERCSPQPAGIINISNDTMPNTFKLHARRIYLLAAGPDALNPPSVVNSTLTMIQSKTWRPFPTSSTFITSQTGSLNHRHLLCCWSIHTPVLVLPWAITLLIHGYMTLRVALGWTYKTIPTTSSRHVKRTNISRVGSSRRAWRRTITMCWRRNTPLYVSQPSQMGLASGTSWLAFLIIRLSGSGNYTFRRIWEGMTITNAVSITGDETSSKAWCGRSGSQPTPSITFTPLSVARTALRHWNASKLKFTLQTSPGRPS